jgi:hypothetical protein
MEVILTLLSMVTLIGIVWLSYNIDVHEGLFTGLILLFLLFIGILIHYTTYNKTEYICPTTLSENVGVYHNGKETIVIPPHYNLGEVVVKKVWSDLRLTLKKDTYDLTYDINGVCK